MQMGNMGMQRNMGMQSHQGQGQGKAQSQNPYLPTKQPTEDTSNWKVTLAPGEKITYGGEDRLDMLRNNEPPQAEVRKQNPDDCKAFKDIGDKVELDFMGRGNGGTGGKIFCSKKIRR
jgi:hypothetical protein